LLLLFMAFDLSCLILRFDLSKGVEFLSWVDNQNYKL